VNLAGGMLACGAQVDVVLVRAEGGMLDQLPSGAALRQLGGRTAWAAPALARYLRQQRPTALVSFLEQANVAAVVARRMARRWRGALAVTEHAAFAIHRRRPVSFRHRLALAGAPIAYRDADVLIGVSAGTAQDWSRRLGGRVRCEAIHNPVIGDDCTSRAAAPGPHPWFDEEPGPLLAVGRLAPEKDHATLLESLARPALAGRRLVIIGDGPERRALESLAERLGLGGRVLFMGHCPDPFPAMARASVLVNPSRYEGFGNVLVEALACGTRVVATDCPFGPREILADGRWGRLVPPGDPDSLAAGIVAALAAAPDRAALQTRAQDFHQRRIAGRYLEVLAAVCQTVCSRGD
jgi:glycosyltransferase involved in cell wall biosynthesis